MAAYRSWSLAKQLFLVLAGPTALALALVALLTDRAASEALEDALAQRLISVAQAASTLVSPRVLLLEPGDDQTRGKRNALAKLTTLKERTQVERILVVRLDKDSCLIDSRGELRVGDKYLRADFDRHELQSIPAGKSVASLLFEGPDKHPYKTGYAPFHDREGQVAGYIAVAAPANYTAALSGLRYGTLGSIIFSLALLLLASAAFASRLAQPLKHLSQVAQRIGEGAMETSIPHEGPKEARILAETMTQMVSSLKARDEQTQMMLAGIAHEVRNPLGGIELFGGILKEDLEGDKRQKYVDKILRELGVLARVVNDFLDYARHQHLDIKKTSLSELGFEVVALAENLAQEKGCKVSTTIDSRLEAEIDRESVQRAWLNLLRNALQAIPKEGGEVHLNAQLNAEGLEISVEDNGPGVPEEKREEIFKPFFTTKQKGTGLGLALAKKTAATHQGKLSVRQSSALGGAHFSLLLPQGINIRSNHG